MSRARAVNAVTPGREHLLDGTLADRERRLDPARFFRLHRATLVNLAWVGEVLGYGGGPLVVRLGDAVGTELPVARDRARELRERLGI